MRPHTPNGSPPLWLWPKLEALMIREVHVRFAGGAGSYVWTFASPVLWIALLVVSFEWLGRTPAILVDVPSFVASGMLPYVIFRQTVTAMGRAMSAARNLRHLGARFDDTLLAAGVLELLNACVLFALIFSSIALIWGPTPVDAPLTAIGAVGLVALLGFSFGRLAAVLGQVSDAANRAIPLALRPLFWVSGVFFVAAELAQPMAGWLWWNPILHASELLRTGLYDSYDSRFFDLRVPLIASLGALATSVGVQRAAGYNIRGQALA
ncbi:MAG: ABC transporter permease [Pseudomonadota bacterium]